MSVDKDWGQGMRNTFHEWAAQLVDVKVLKTISTDYLRMIRSEMLHAIGRIDDEVKRRESKHS